MKKSDHIIALHLKGDEADADAVVLACELDPDTNLETIKLPAHEGSAEKLETLISEAAESGRVPCLAVIVSDGTSDSPTITQCVVTAFNAQIRLCGLWASSAGEDSTKLPSLIAQTGDTVCRVDHPDLVNGLCDQPVFTKPDGTETDKVSIKHYDCASNKTI